MLQQEYTPFQVSSSGPSGLAAGRDNISDWKRFVSAIMISAVPQEVEQFLTCSSYCLRRGYLH